VIALFISVWIFPRGFISTLKDALEDFLLIVFVVVYAYLYAHRYSFLEKHFY